MAFLFQNFWIRFPSDYRGLATHGLLLASVAKVEPKVKLYIVGTTLKHETKIDSGLAFCSNEHLKIMLVLLCVVWLLYCKSIPNTKLEKEMQHSLNLSFHNQSPTTSQKICTFTLQSIGKSFLNYVGLLVVLSCQVCNPCLPFDVPLQSSLRISPPDHRGQWTQCRKHSIQFSQKVRKSCKREISVFCILWPVKVKAYR